VKLSVYFDLKQNAKLPASPFSCDIVVERICVSYSYFDVKMLIFQLFDFVSNSINHESPNFYGKGPHRLLQAGSRVKFDKQQ
jgi:hypothetical protein